MAFLEKFAPDEREMLVSLPYRAGIWVGNSDGGPLPDAADSETAALERVIQQLGRGAFKSAFAHEVMAEMISRRKDWPEWAKNAADVPALCEKAVALVGAKLGAHDLDGYRSNIMSIAVAVAKAFREFDYTESPVVRVWTYIKLSLDQAIGLFTGERFSNDDILNISYAEDMSLATLAKALGIDSELPAK
jgi:hypothetical protein